MRTKIQAVLLVNDGSAAVIRQRIACCYALNCIIQPMNTAKVSLGVLLTIIKRCFGTSFFGDHQRLAHAYAGSVSMAANVQCFQGAISDMNAVSAVLHVQLRTAVSHRTAVGQAEGFRAITKHGIHAQRIAHTCQAAVVKEQAATVFTAGITACIVAIYGPGNVLRLIGADDVISSSRLAAGLHADAQLHIVGGIKTQQVLIKLIDIIDTPLLQAHALRDIAALGIFVALNLDFVSCAFDKIDFYYAALNRLCRQHGTAGVIALVKIKLVDFVDQLIQILDADFFFQIFTLECFQLSLFQHLRFIKLNSLQRKGNSRLLLIYISSLALLYLGRRLSLILSNLASYTHTLHVFHSTVGSNAGVIQAALIKLCLVRISWTRSKGNGTHAHKQPCQK